MRWRLSKLDWPYAVGELIIVTAGVLIALAIDQWNSDRLDRVEEQRILLGLKSEFELNLARTERELAYRHAIVSSILQLFDASAGRASFEPKELDQLIGDVTWWANAEYSTGALESLLEGGMLSIIESEELRDLLASLPSAYDAAALDEMEEMETARGIIYPFLSKNSSFTQIANTMAAGRPGVGDTPTPSIYPVGEQRDHSTLLSDSEFLGILVREHWDHLDAIEEYGKLQTEIERVMRLIDEELKD